MSKPAIHGFVTPEAHQAWHDYAANHGVSVTAILEALSGALPMLDDYATMRLVSDARQIDASRRRRKAINQ